MSTSNPSPEPSLDTNLDDLYTKLDELDPAEEDYATAVDHLVKLHKLAQEEEKIKLERSKQILDSQPKPLSKDTMVLAGANLLGIILIVGHERAHVVTSKAIGFIKMLR
jgi:hypothetical protein